MEHTKMNEDDKMNYASISLPAAQDESKFEEYSEIQLLRLELNSIVNEALSDCDCNRFLRARSHDVYKAKVMIEDWWIWWHTPLEYNGGILLTPATVLKCGMSEVESHIHHKQDHINNYFYISLRGEDKGGHPIYWDWAGRSSTTLGEAKKYFSVEELIVLHIRIMELMIRRTELASIKYNRNIEKILFIYDLSELSYNIDLHGLKAFQSMVTVDQRYYPERLHRMVMINAPWFFSYIWAIIRPWIDPNTVEKIAIFGTDFLPQLQELVSDENIPEMYGGKMQGFRWHAPWDDSSGVSPTQMAAYMAAKRSDGNEK